MIGANQTSVNMNVWKSVQSTWWVNIASKYRMSVRILVNTYALDVDNAIKIVHKFDSNAFQLHSLPFIQQNKVLGLIGVNGIGKSTILNMFKGGSYQISDFRMQHMRISLSIFEVRHFRRFLHYLNQMHTPQLSNLRL